MATFFLAAEQLGENEINIEGDLYHHLANVLRFQVGDPIHCSDGKSICIDGHIAAIDKKKNYCHCTSKDRSDRRGLRCLSR